VDTSEYYCPNDLKAETGALVEYHNDQQYHESLNDVMPADAYGCRDQFIPVRWKRIRIRKMKQRRKTYPKYLAETK
jgi:hypothetical protein